MTIIAIVEEAFFSSSRDALESGDGGTNRHSRGSAYEDMHPLVIKKHAFYLSCISFATSLASHCAVAPAAPKQDKADDSVFEKLSSVG